MRWWHRHGEHLVDYGTVGCPARGHDVAVDVCLECRWFEGLDESRDPPVVWCRPPVTTQPRYLWPV